MKLGDLPQALEALAREDLLREPDDGVERLQMLDAFSEHFIDAATNDYLGLARSSAVDVSRGTLDEKQASDVSRGTSSLQPGSGASRLVYGTAPEHLELERVVARWTKMEEALFFSSGYAANVGTLGALLSPEDAVFSDALNHASIVDGIRLSRARPSVYSHLNLDELEEGLRGAKSAPARWVLTESYYSMDGDGPDLGRLVSLCRKYEAGLYVDEAHAVGVFGPEGAGLCAEAGVTPDVLLIGFGKALGSEGACILGAKPLRTWLWNKARSFVFSTAPSPLRVSSLLKQIARARAAEGSRRRLKEICRQLRNALAEAGVCLSEGSFGPIVSLQVGSAARALELSRRLKEYGLLTQAIRPPTVPDGACRLRLVLRSDLSPAQVDRLVFLVSRETRAEL